MTLLANPKIPLRLKGFPVEDSLCEATHLSSKGGYVSQTVGTLSRSGTFISDMYMEKGEAHIEFGAMG